MHINQGVECVCKLGSAGFQFPRGRESGRASYSYAARVVDPRVFVQVEAYGALRAFTTVFWVVLVDEEDVEEQRDARDRQTSPRRCRISLSFHGVCRPEPGSTCVYAITVEEGVYSAATLTSQA